MITSTKSQMGQVTQLKSRWIVKVKVLGEISQKIAKVKVFEQNTNLREEKTPSADSSKEKVATIGDQLL